MLLSPTSDITSSRAKCRPSSATSAGSVFIGTPLPTDSAGRDQGGLRGKSHLSGGGRRRRAGRPSQGRRGRVSGHRLKCLWDRGPRHAVAGAVLFFKLRLCSLRHAKHRTGRPRAKDWKSASSPAAARVPPARARRGRALRMLNLSRCPAAIFVPGSINYLVVLTWIPRSYEGRPLSGLRPPC